MKITQDRLRQIIKEELQAVLREEESAEESMTLSDLTWQPYEHTNSIGQTRKVMMFRGTGGADKHVGKNEFENVKKEFIKKYGDIEVEKTDNMRDLDIIAISGAAEGDTTPVFWKKKAGSGKYADEDERIAQDMKSYYE